MKKVIAAVLVLMMVCGFALADRSLFDLTIINELVNVLDSDTVSCEYDDDLDMIIMTYHNTEISRTDWAFSNRAERDILIDAFTDFSGLHEKINSKLNPDRIDTMFKAVTSDGYPMIVIFNGKNVTKVLDLD